MHRLLGLSIVRIGTGQRAGSGHDSNKFELNALSTALVPDLRAALLAGAQQARRLETPGTPVESITEPVDTEIGHWEPSWVRYAPFSFTGIAIIAAIIGISFQYGIGTAVAKSSAVSDSFDSLESLGIALMVVIALVVLLVLSSALACVQYLIAFGNMKLTDNGRILHVSHGLLKTRQTTLDRARPPRHDAQGTAPSAIGPRRAARRHHDRGQRREEGIFATAPAGTAQGSRASDGHRDR